MAKWPNHFISGKQFQKRPNGNPDLFADSVIQRDISNQKVEQ